MGDWDHQRGCFLGCHLWTAVNGSAGGLHFPQQCLVYHLAPICDISVIVFHCPYRKGIGCVCHHHRVSVLRRGRAGRNLPSVCHEGIGGQRSCGRQDQLVWLCVCIRMADSRHDIPVVACLDFYSLRAKCKSSVAVAAGAGSNTSFPGYIVPSVGEPLAQGTILVLQAPHQLGSTGCNRDRTRY